MASTDSTTATLPLVVRKGMFGKESHRGAWLRACGVLLLVLVHAGAAADPGEVSLADFRLEGIALNGVTETDEAGSSLDIAGDINGDGLADILVGANNADVGDVDQAGKTYVVFGSARRVPRVQELLQIEQGDGSAGFVLNGTGVFDRSGTAVRGAGDINGDGIDDLLIGADRALDSVGSAFVVFGRAGAFPAQFDLADLLVGDGSEGFVLPGIRQDDLAGGALSAAGDVNGDGIDDIVIGASRAPAGASRGESYVVFGDRNGFPAEFALASLAAGDGSRGFVIRGGENGDAAGMGVSGAGDVNGDGLADILIGASEADGINDDSFGTGEAYVVYGSAEGFDPVFPLSRLASGDGSAGTVLFGINPIDFTGVNVSVGDLNGDGLDDLAISANFADPGGRVSAGSTYIVFGRLGGLGAVVELAALADGDGHSGVVINGIDERDFIDGAEVVDDINGDGIDDLIIGATGGDPGGREDAGEAYVVYGSQSGFPGQFELASLLAGNGEAGFVINGIGADDRLGGRVSGGGDVNGDGFGDLLITASSATVEGRGRAGQSYVLFGQANFPAQVELSDLTTPPLAIRAKEIARSVGRCDNTTSGQVLVRAAPLGRLNCEENGLSLDGGDQVRVSLRGSALVASFSGAASGVSEGTAQCSNATSGESREQPLDPDGNWDCAGLPIQPGDQVLVVVSGTAQ